MSNGTLKIGVACVVLGLLLLAGDNFLPVDLWPSLNRLFLGTSQAKHSYLRVVPAENSELFELALIGVGVLLVGLSVHFRKKQ